MLTRTLRILGILLGLFYAATAVLDLLGVIPYSAAKPSFASRMWTNVPLLAGGFALLAPFRKLQGHHVRVGVALFLLVLCLEQSAFSLSGTVAFVHGQKGILFLPITIINLFIVWGNLALLFSTPRQELKRVVDPF